MHTVPFGLQRGVLGVCGAMRGDLETSLSRLAGGDEL